MRALRSYQSTMRWSVVTALLLSVLALCQASETLSSTRSLRQNADRQTRITEENVGNLPRLVNETRNAMVFVFATDVDLPSIITVRRRRLTFRGAEGRRPTIRCASGEGGFVVRANQTAFENLIIRDCNQTAILVADEVEEYNPFESDDPPDEAERLDVTIREVDFIGNVASDDDIPAGAFVAMEKVHAELIGCHFERNVGVTGGAIAFSGDSLLVDECTFERNNASRSGGAIQARREVEDAVERSNSSVTVSKCTFTENRSSNGGKDRIGLTLTGSVDLEPNRYVDFPLPAPSGGAVYVSGFERVNFQSSNFTANSAVPAGGAIYLRDSKGVEVSGCRFARNFVLTPSADVDSSDLQQGGALYVAFEGESELVIQRCNFANNSAVYGGALHFVGRTNAPFNMLKCTFRNNVASLGGGAVLFRNIAAPTVEKTHFIQNSAFLGGAVLLTNGAGLDVVQTNDGGAESSFVDNVAHDGGGIFGIGGGPLKLFRVVFNGNLAERRGGAVCYVDSKASGTLAMQDARMSRNRAETGGAIFLDNVFEFALVPGANDRGTRLFRGWRSQNFNFFEKNVAVSGGAIYYRASNLVRNRFAFTSVRFSNNRAQSNLSLVHEESLNFPGFNSGAGGFLPTTGSESERGATDAADRTLLNPRSSQPCHPGGGGAVCAVLSGMADRTPVGFQVLHSNFTRNRAVVGGALLIATETDVNWKSRCTSGGNATRAALTANPCRSLTLRDVRFERNRAEAAGGAIFATNLSDVFYSTAEREDARLDYRRLSEGIVDERFKGNNVVSSGYGANIAGTAVRLRIRRPRPNPSTGILLRNQSSGQSTPLDPIVVEILDDLDQVVTDGILDSTFTVRADSYRPGTNKSIASGQVNLAAERGVARFEALSLTAVAGTYNVSFSERRNGIEDARGSVELRHCLLGERFLQDALVCQTCPVNKFTFYVNISDCVDCPSEATCHGGASLVPRKGQWHSSPFSVAMHRCFHEDACSYSHREETLNEDRRVNLTMFYERFDEEIDPVFSNEEYKQCADGYHGPVCGSCQSGYGQVNGKSCAKCASRSTTALVIFLLGLWQMLFLAFTVRSALVAIRDMNQMMALRRQQAESAPSSKNQMFSWVHRIMGLTPSVRRTRTYTQIDSPAAPNPAQTPEEAPSAVPGTRQITSQQQSVDYIIANQYLSETIKIFVNFFQITSVAANINLQWTEEIKDMLATMSSVAGFSQGASVTPLTCLLEQDSSRRSVDGIILRIVFPLCLMLLVMVVFWMRAYAMTRSPNYTRKQCSGFIRSRTIIAFLVVGFFAYQSISEDLLTTVICIRLDTKSLSDVEKRYDDAENGVDFSKFLIATDRYWVEDTTVKCYSKDHALLVGFLGIPGILLFTCGVPLYLLGFLLHKRQRQELMTLDVLNTYGFIYQNYNQRFVYWEVLILMRKALISAIVVFAYPLGASLQGIMALGVLIIALSLHLIAAPFKYAPLNVLEGCSLVVTIFTFYSGIVFHDENTSDDGKLLLSVALIVVNSVMAMVFCLAVYVYMDRYVVARLKVEGVTAIPKFPPFRIVLLIYLLSQRVVSLISTRVGQTQRTGARRQKPQRQNNATQSPPTDPRAQTVQFADDSSPVEQNTTEDAQEVTPDTNETV